MNDNRCIMKFKVKNMENEIPLGKQLKYALQEKEALQEELDEVGADFDRAAEEVSELKFLLDEATKLEILEQNHIDLIAAKFHEWTTQMNCAFEEGFFDIK